MIPGVPYDAEIEYLESTGTQYIDTGVYPGPYTRSETDIAITNWDKHAYSLTGISDTYRHAFGKGYGGSSSASSGNNTFLYFGLGAQNYVSNVKLTALLGERHLYFVNALTKKAGYDNVSFSLTSTGTIKTTAHTSLLLAQYSGNIRGQMAAKLYGCKFYENGILVRDLIPVRVGQTGYMYDRVTKRLFGNKGTGSFVLGPDAAKPVMGLWGMRISKSIDYTRNGLVALYDGIDNAGYNKHDSSATVWKDLTDNHYDLTTNGTPSWRYNGAYINTKSNSFWRSSIPQFRTLWESQNGLFIECICQLGVSFLFSYGGSVPTVESFAAEIKNVNYYRKFFSFISPIKTPYFDWPNNTVGRVWAWANQSSYFVGMNNQSSNGTYTYQQKEKYGFGIGCRGDNSGTASAENTIVFRLAVYDHMLTETEIAHNYAVDKARFNLP